MAKHQHGAHQVPTRFGARKIGKKAQARKPTQKGKGPAGIPKLKPGVRNMRIMMQGKAYIIPTVLFLELVASGRIRRSK